MRYLTNSLNFLILFLAATLFFTIQTDKKLSTDLSALFPKGEEREQYEVYNQFKQAKEIYIAVSGTGQSDLKKIEDLEKRLDRYKEISLKDSFLTDKFGDYVKKYKFYIADLEAEELSLEERVKKTYDAMVESPYYFSVDRDDPLSLFHYGQEGRRENMVNNRLAMDNYGYLSVFTIGLEYDSLEDFKRVYNNVYEEVKSMDGVKVFSPLFYYVENSAHIKSQVNYIVFFSVLILTILYLFLIKNLRLFLNVGGTLVTSVLVSQIVLKSIFPEVSIFAFVFGIAITSVSIDYMFHHYLHGYYEKGFRFNKSVFYGFFTTITVFFLISFINFPLLEQIAVFSIVSLTTAYLHFAFLYPFLGLKQRKEPRLFSIRQVLNLAPLSISLISLVILAFAVSQMAFDFNIKNLDYQNVKLKKTEELFKKGTNTQDMVAVLVEGNSLDSLVKTSRRLKTATKESIVPLASLVDEGLFKRKREEIEKRDFDTLKKRVEQSAVSIGFRRGFFQNSYPEKLLYPKKPEYSIEYLKSLGFDIVKHKGMYFTAATIHKTDIEKIRSIENLSVMDSKKMFDSSMRGVYEETLIFGSIAVAAIAFILFFVTKKRFIPAINYTLFPLCGMLLLSLFVSLNIMHLFMLFIIIAIGIDYGVYMNEKEVRKDTQTAILYSLLSTFAGFGILIISDINSLFSIGITATIGIIAIIVLIMIQRRDNAEN